MMCRQIVLRGGPGGVVRLGDVADVHPGAMPQFFAVSANGKRAVTLLVYQQPGTDMVAIAHAAQAALSGFAPQLPPGVTLSKWYDQSTLMLAAAGSGTRCHPHRRRAGGAGAAGLPAQLARHAARRARSCPCRAGRRDAGALAVRQSFNIMTLGGMAAAIGLIIDDVIVMIEHIERRAGRGEAGAAGWVVRAGRSSPPAHRLVGGDADRLRRRSPS